MAGTCPPVQLAVDGGVQASRFVLPAPRATTVTVGAPAFQVTPSDDEDVSELERNGSGFIAVADTQPAVDLVAPVPALPPGATITGFRCSWVDDNATSDVFLEFDLQGRLDISLGAFQVAQVRGETTGASSTIGFLESQPLDHTVSGPRVSYFISGRWFPSLPATPSASTPATWTWRWRSSSPPEARERSL